jgi:hypothetical protein
MSIQSTVTSRLKRPLQPMPAFVSQALLSRGLMRAYRGRPGYQRNDYLSWIQRAKRAATRQKRLSQMLDELKRGDRYMNMVHRPRKKIP